MKNLSTTLKVLTCSIFILTLSSLAQAQTRTWVSGVGDDLNPCSRTAPCKTYAGAISKTSKDGEISTLDPGGFGAVTITKSITINGGGGGAGYGSILAAGTNGVTVNITDAADVRKTVRLNWLDINGASSGFDGIRFLAGSALIVENTNIDGFTSDGIEVLNNPQAVHNLNLRNVSIRNCVGNGVKITNTGTNATVMAFDNVMVTRSGNGLNAGNGSRGQISNSFFGESPSGSGVVTSQSTSPTDIAVDNSSVVANATGVNAGASTHIRIARCVITGNTNALGTSGLVDTGGNNTIQGNATNQNPNGTLLIEK
jgi:hypothetical protein